MYYLLEANYNSRNETYPKRLFELGIIGTHWGLQKSKQKKTVKRTRLVKLKLRFQSILFYFDIYTDDYLFEIITVHLVINYLSRFIVTR